MNHAQIRKNRIRRIFLIAFLCCAFGCLLAGAFISGMPFEAHAEAKNLNDESTATLFLPSSYEQYLVLNEPSDIALSDSYIAIADGNVLYIYDRTSGLYTKNETSEDSGTITKIGFAGNRLFVATRGNSGIHCYEYNFTNGESDKFNNLPFNCSTFCISGDTLYAASVGGGSTTFTSYSISNLKGNLSDSIPSKSLGTLNKQTTPSMTKLGDFLYCTIDDQVYHINPSFGQFNESTPSFYLSSVTSDTKNVRSTCSHENAFYYTADGGLYRAELATTDNAARKATCVLDGEGYNAFTSYNGALYCLREKSVVELKVNEDGSVSPTDYEISSSSESVNRLNNAQDSTRAGNLLVAADTGNRRISVYDMEKDTFETISVEYSPTLIATDGSVIAAASDNTIHAYSRDAYRNWNEISTQALDTSDKVSGIACVFGQVYYVSAHKRGVLGGTSVLDNNTPTGLTANLYGDLFVAANNSKVYHFTEETFVQEGTGDETETKLPDGFSSLRADFQGNLYYLNDGKMYCNGEETAFAEIDGKDFVYTGGEEKQPVSFALGFEDDEVYFLFGDFIVKSNAGALGFPSLGTISAEGIYDEVTRVHKKDEGGVSLLDVKEHSIGIRVALEKLDKETAFFPYSSYSRTNETERAVQLARTDGYRLVALYENKTYTVELFREEDLVVYGEEGEDPAFAPSWTGENGTRYFAVDTFVYNYPCLSAARTNVQLPRGTKVQLCDVVLPVKGDSVAPVAVSVDNGGGENGFEFAYVEYTNAEGERTFGYVPLSFLSTIDPTGVQKETFTLGTLKENVSFRDERGETIDVAAGEEVMLYDNGDGTFTAAVERDGVRYTAQVNDKIVSHGESDALRIALIVILTALAVVIIGAYFFLLPRSKYGKKKN